MTFQWNKHIDSPATRNGRSEYATLLGELLDHVGLNPKGNCIQVVDELKGPISTSLQSSMQLSKGQPCSVSVSDYIPPELHRIIEEIPEILLWIIAFVPQLRIVGPLLDHVSGSKVEIYEYLGVRLNDEALNSTSGDLELVLSEAEDKIKQIFDAIVGSCADKLGSYSPVSRRIEIYWIPIFIVSLVLSIPLDRLTYIVLIHELAHYFSHAGKDADGKKWDTNMFCESDIYIVEGVAQFWTNELSLKPHSKLGIISTHTVHGCFKKLLDNQRSPYTCFMDWLPNHPRRIESVRSALLVTRENGGDYDDFRRQLQEFSSVFS